MIKYEKYLKIIVRNIPRMRKISYTIIFRNIRILSCNYSQRRPNDRIYTMFDTEKRTLATLMPTITPTIPSVDPTITPHWAVIEVQRHFLEETVTEIVGEYFTCRETFTIMKKCGFLTEVNYLRTLTMVVNNDDRRFYNTDK